MKTSLKFKKMYSKFKKKHKKQIVNSLKKQIAFN